MGLPPAVLIYDGSCGLCRGGVSWISRRAVRGHLEFLPCQAAERRARYPWMDERACLEAMQLILPDGRVFSGAEAVFLSRSFAPRSKWLLAAYRRVPGFAALARLTYRTIAAAPITPCGSSSG